jgi:hypothetical protein
VDVEQAGQVLGRQRVYAAPVAVPDVVHQHIDRSQGADRFPCRVLIGNVERGGGDGQSLVPQPRRCGVKRAGVAPVEDHPGARPAQAARHLQAQPAHRAGDQGGAPGQREIRNPGSRPSGHLH